MCHNSYLYPFLEDLMADDILKMGKMLALTETEDVGVVILAGVWHEGV